MSDEYNEHLRSAAMLWRNEIIEECASVAESWYGDGDFTQFKSPQSGIAAAIRALKDTK